MDQAQILDEFRRDAEKITQDTKLANLFSTAIKKLGCGGYDAWCLQEGTLNNPQQPGNFFFHDYNLNVVIDYILTSLLPTDPTMVKIGQISAPFNFVEFLKSANKNTSVKWQLKMLALFNVHYAWTIPCNITGANRGVTCYYFGNSQSVRKKFEADRSIIQLISLEFIDNMARIYFDSSVDFLPQTQLRYDLSPRELDCLHWAARGKTNIEIAELLCVSQNTVRYHMKNIFKKFNVKTRSNAVLLAIQAGLIAG